MKIISILWRETIYTYIFFAGRFNLKANRNRSKIRTALHFLLTRDLLRHGFRRRCITDIYGKTFRIIHLSPIAVRQLIYTCLKIHSRHYHPVVSLVRRMILVIERAVNSRIFPCPVVIVDIKNCTLVEPFLTIRTKFKRHGIIRRANASCRQHKGKQSGQ